MWAPPKHFPLKNSNSEIEHPSGTRRFAILAEMAKAAAAKKIFLVDAMGFIFRAYFAPMGRLNSPSGVPTKVPYLFSNMLRKIQKEYSPDYLAVVFDTREPTFRDKLFDKYKAQRPPMPDDLAVQLPYVRKMCEAMRLPILEYDGFEADDVIGALSKQAAKKGLEVSIVTSDKDMMQLVGGSVRVLRPGAGPDKGDLVVDAAKVEEIMGVPPEKVADVMALMGDSIDNIPGAKGIGEKGAKELIRRFGSVEAALDARERSGGKAIPRSAGKQRGSRENVEAARGDRCERAGKTRAGRSSCCDAGRGSVAHTLRRAGIYFAAA